MITRMLLLLLSYSQIAYTAESVDGEFSAKLSVELYEYAVEGKSNQKSGVEIETKLSLKNSSSRAVCIPISRVPGSAIDISAYYEVRDKNHSPVPYLGSEGYPVKNTDMISPSMILLLPGEVKRFSETIHQYYRFIDGEKYVIHYYAFAYYCDDFNVSFKFFPTIPEKAFFQSKDEKFKLPK